MLVPGALQRVADFFSRNPQCDIVFGNGDVIDEQGKRLKHCRARDFTARRYFYGGTQWLQQSTFFRAEAFRRTAGFNIENRTCWDGELFVNLVSRGARPGYIDANLAVFRIHPSFDFRIGKSEYPIPGRYTKDLQPGARPRLERRRRSLAVPLPCRGLRHPDRVSFSAAGGQERSMTRVAVLWSGLSGT